MKTKSEVSAPKGTSDPVAADDAEGLGVRGRVRAFGRRPVAVKRERPTARLPRTVRRGPALATSRQSGESGDKSPHPKAPRVVVVGSLNLDLIAQVERLPDAGETVPATDLLRRFGGKGANQAVAAARQGAAVTMIGCVGDDSEGAIYREHLANRENINVRAIRRVSQTPTGTALIAVDRRGQNNIVVVAGANARLTAAAVRARAQHIRMAQALLLQLEVPLPAVLEAMHLANAAGVPIVFNPSPLRADFPWGRVKLHTVIVNELEARQIFGRPTSDWAGDSTARQRLLAKRQIAHLLVTRGAESTLCLTATRSFTIATLRVRPVDTVGAGDAFAGTFTARMAEGCELEEAIALANSAGALATLERGAQEAMPRRRATERARLKLRHFSSGQATQ